MNKESDDGTKSLRFLVKVEKPVQRPETPTIPEPYVYRMIGKNRLRRSRDMIKEAKDCAATYLQRLVRGRHEQVLMHQGLPSLPNPDHCAILGKERRMSLIHELRARKEVDKASMDDKRTDEVHGAQTVNLQVRFRNESRAL